jgi:hypothetical protein
MVRVANRNLDPGAVSPRPHLPPLRAVPRRGRARRAPLAGGNPQSCLCRRGQRQSPRQRRPAPAGPGRVRGHPNSHPPRLRRHPQPFIVSHLAVAARSFPKTPRAQKAQQAWRSLRLCGKKPGHGPEKRRSRADIAQYAPDQAARLFAPEWWEHQQQRGSGAVPGLQTDGQQGSRRTGLVRAADGCQSRTSRFIPALFPTRFDLALHQLPVVHGLASRISALCEP